MTAPADDSVRPSRTLAVAEACERNKDPILAVLRAELTGARTLLEIGSGTGQHAVYFAAALPTITWQTSDRRENHETIRAWLEARPAPNLLAPLALDVAADEWPSGPYDAVFSANTAHIMGWPEVCAMFAGVGRVVSPGGRFLLYGPFSYDGRHTSASNESFDRMLRRRDPASGVRDLRRLDEEARRAGLERTADYEMPANNRTIVWRRT
jgi:cyclopropane fatty-acyl-phospholipid synthase-like methyltransferase